MAGFFLYRSASTQALADRLVQVVAAPEGVLPPDQDEIVVVQGRGMEQWLSRRAAARLGVWAGATFPFPRAAVAELSAQVLGEGVTRRAHDDALVLALAVAAELPEMMRQPEGGRVQRYIREGGQARALSFARQAAQVLDGYLVYRPELLEAWSEGGANETGDPDEPWQAWLWRAIQRRAAACGDDLAAIVGFWPRVRRAVRALEEGAPCPGVQRVSVFAVGALPPQLVSFFTTLGRACDVYWYAVDPAAETPGSPAGLVESLATADLEGVMVVRDAAERARASGVAVQEGVLSAAGETEPSGTLLHRVQTLARTGRWVHGQGVEQGDRSLRVHACPGNIRQVEVLHDEILRAFDELPELTPEDVVVLVPDVSTYAPAIEAVLQGGRGIARVPGSVADVSSREDSPAAAALATALRIADGDMGVRDVMELLAQPAVAERWLPAGTDTQSLAQGLMQAGVKRFLDLAHRESAGLPATDECTWDAALMRLYAGLAAPPGCMDPVPGAGIFPAQPFLMDAATLGRLSEWVQLLRDLRGMALPQERGHDGATGGNDTAAERDAAAESGRPVREWVERIQALVLRLMPAHGAAERQARALVQQLGAVAHAAEVAGFEAPVPFPAMRALLLERLTAHRPGRGFLAGGVTVCQLVPMRAVPFRLVCMLGMDDDRFPRGGGSLGFDLAAQNHRPGDRDARAEDRALFLESVLGAGERLVMTYDARELTTGTERAPSVVVTELLEAAARVACPVDADTQQVQQARRRLILEHPRHAFSVGAFDARAVREDRVGYDAQARQGAEQLARVAAGQRGNGPDAPEEEPFLRASVGGLGVESTAADAGVVEVSLDQLTAFFKDPARETLRAWGVKLPYAKEVPPDHEPVEIRSREQGLLKYQIMDALLKARAPEPDELVSRMQQEGVLPPGVYGRRLGEELVGQVRALLQQAYGAGPSWHPVDVRIGTWRLTGRVPVVDGGVHQVVTGTSVSATRMLGSWITQLAWAVGSGQGAAQGAIYHASSGTAQGSNSKPLPAIGEAEARECLETLLVLRAFGLRQGLPFFPEISEEAAKILRKPRAGAAVIEKARAKMDDEDNAYSAPVLSDAAQVLFRGMDALTMDLGAIPGMPGVSGSCRATFLDVARKVFEPLYAHLQPVPRRSSTRRPSP